MVQYQNKLKVIKSHNFQNNFSNFFVTRLTFSLSPHLQLLSLQRLLHRVVMEFDSKMEKFNEKETLLPSTSNDQQSDKNNNNNKRWLKTILIVSLTLIVLVVNFRPSLLASIIPSHYHHQQVESSSTRGNWRDRRSIRNYYSYFKSTLSTRTSCHQPTKEQVLEDLFLSVPTTESAKQASHSLVSLLSLISSVSSPPLTPL